MSTAIDEIIARLNGVPEESRKKVVDDALHATANLKWIPNPGPQTDAYFSKADVLLYGGSAGGGKSELVLGLALSVHQRTLIMRRQYTDLGGMIDRLLQVHGSREGFNGQPPPKLRCGDGRLIEFGAAKNLGDEQTWQGQPHDLLAFDEAVQFLEEQVRFVMGWVRSTDPNQRCRTILATNPPVTAEGQWIIGMFRPWLDLTHENPAEHGELRWFVTAPDGSDVEVDGPAPVEMGDRTLIPQSRTFIPAALKDNPFLIDTGYQAQLDALKEPLRSAVRDGNFMVAREDGFRQVIPAAWVRDAQNRWKPDVNRDMKMTAMGVDVAQGGVDQSVIAMRYGTWYAPLVSRKGADTPHSPAMAAFITEYRRDGSVIIIDVGGGYGGGTVSYLKDNEIPSAGFNGAMASKATSADGQLKFINKRAESWWRFREVLDPSQDGGSPIALPPDENLVQELTAPEWELTPRGIKIEQKVDIKKRLGRSTDRADAVIMAWSEGEGLATRRRRRKSKGLTGRPDRTSGNYDVLKW